MPNHVYHTIKATTDKGRKVLKEISKTEYGICGYVNPMPKELTGTTSPQRIPETISKEESNRLKDLYGHDNWYEWCYRNWGTKWGCYDQSYDEVRGTLHFVTAWSPFNFDVLYLLIKKLPDFIWTWEEEQGFGEEEEFQDGECIRSFSWDLPEISEDIVEVDGVEYMVLLSDHVTPDQTFPAGYYLAYEPLEEGRVAETMEELNKKVLDNS